MSMSSETDRMLNVAEAASSEEDDLDALEARLLPPGVCRRASFSFGDPSFNELSAVYRVAEEPLSHHHQVGFHPLLLVTVASVRLKKLVLSHKDDAETSLLLEPAKAMAPRLAVTVAIVAADAFLTIGSSIYNSHLMRLVPGFSFPLTYAFVTCATTFAGSAVLVYQTKTPASLSEMRLHLPSLIGMLLAALRPAVPS